MTSSATLLSVLRSHRWWMLAATVMGAGAGFLLGQLGSGTATAEIPIAVSDDAITQAGGEGYGVDELRQVVSAMAESGSTAGRIAGVAGVSASELTVVTQSDTRSPVIMVSVTAPMPSQALNAASAIPGVVAEERQRLFADHHRAVLDGDGAGTGEGGDADLDQDVDLEAVLAAAGTSVRALDEPSIKRSAPTSVVLAVLGALAAATATFGLAVLLFDRRRERGPWRQGIGPTPELWEIEPDEEPSSLLMVERGSSVPFCREIETEVYEWILDRIAGPSVSVLGVAGSEVDDGTGMTAVSLAAAQANRGGNVALISLGIPPAACSADELDSGLKGVVHGSLDLSEALIQLESRGTLLYLPPGDIHGSDWSAHHQEYIRHQIQRLLSRGVNLVVLELPPVLSFEDPRPVLNLTDGVVLSSVRRMTDQSAAADARRWIRRSQPSLLGEIVHLGQVSRPLFVRGRPGSELVAKSVA